MRENKKQKRLNPLFQAGIEYQNKFQELKWPFCFIGGIAVIRWGEIRITQDIDLCLLCGFGNEEQYINTLLSTYKSRIPDAQAFALQNRIILLYASNGVSVDIALSGLSFEEEMIRRATPFMFYKHCSLITCSAEDLIILKSFANRARDWTDVESVIMRQGNKLNTKYIIDQLLPLCEIKNTPEVINELKTLFRQFIHT